MSGWVSLSAFNNGCFVNNTVISECLALKDRSKGRVRCNIGPYLFIWFMANPYLCLLYPS